MPGQLPFLVTIYDKAFVRQGWVGDYEQIAVTVRHNGVGTASLTVRADHPRVAALMAAGARVTIDYRAPDSAAATQLMSGPCWAAQGSFGNPDERTITFTVEDDLRLLGQVLGWPVPSAAIGAQSAQAYDVRTGAAETVLKQYLSANAVSRLGLPLTVAATAGRGATISTKLRMDQLAEALLPVVDAAGIGVTIAQIGGVLVCDCYTPTVRPRVLTEDSGILAGGSWTRTGPTATDLVVGGQGDGTARVFRLVRDTGLAAAYGTRVEVFRDATDVTTTPELDARGALGLAEGAPGAGIALQLAETATFRYGRTLRVGDVVTVQLAPGVQVVDVVRAVTLTHSAEGGVEITPQVGDQSSQAAPNYALARALARVAGAVRKISTRR